MVPGTHTHWRMTINNYDATDLALIQQGYPDHIRQLVYTLEEGEEGTPHIQAFIKMKRDVRQCHMKKLFPRGNFGAIDSAEWKLNQQRYAQKLDSTARSPAVITNWDPLLTIEGVMKEVMIAIIPDLDMNGYSRDQLFWLRARREKKMVEKDYKYAKVFVSATYKAMWRDFGEAMYSCIHEQQRTAVPEVAEVTVPTLTHTHSDENFSRRGGITQDAEDDEGRDDSSELGEVEDGEDHEEGEDSSDEGYSESGGSSDCSSDDSEGSGE